MLDQILKLDIFLIEFVQKHLSHEYIQSFFAFFTHLGDFGILTIIALIYINYLKKDKRILKITIISALISLIVVQLTLKNILARPRPFEIIQGLNIFIDYPITHSFPSGHASFATIGLIFSIKYIKEAFIRYIFEVSFVLIIISRFILKVHFFTDILAGFIISYSIIYFVTKYFNKEKSQFK